jgi:hypothetical protein
VSQVRDGQPTGVKGVVKAASIALGLGLGGPDSLKQPGPEDGRPLLSPAQQREVEAGRDPGPAAPDFERKVIRGGRDVWEYLGRPATTPIGEGPEGLPVEPEPLSADEEHKLKERRGELPQRTDWERIDAEQAKRDLAQEYARAEAELRRIVSKEAAAKRRRK